MEYHTRVSELIYLDVCCFKRPFDDATMDRVRREAEAVASILEAVEKGFVRLVRSPAHDFENDRNSREDRRLATMLWLDSAEVDVPHSGDAVGRALELVSVGLTPLDALHVAYAENSTARSPESFGSRS